MQRHHGLRRQNAWTGVEPQEEDEDAFDTSLLSPPTMVRALTRTHTTPRQMTLMRECSQGSAVAELDDVLTVVPQIPFPQLDEEEPTPVSSV
jgi:hypothetical protein